MSNSNQIWALGGESLSAPEDTLPAYWGGLACGAHGLVVGVQLTADDVAVCCDRPTLEATTGDPRAVGEVTWSDLRKLDAGSQFRSTTLDRSWQPAGQGDDTPWEGPSRRQNSLYHPALDDVLRLFGRRAPLLLKLVLPSGGADDRRRLVDGVMHLLHRFGLAEKTHVAGDIAIVRLVRNASKTTPLVLVAGTQKPATAAKSAATLGAAHLMIDAEKIVSPAGRVVAGLTAALGRKVTVLVTSTEMPCVLSPTYFQSLAGRAWVAGFVTRGTLLTRNMATPPALVAEDDFAGKKVNRALWTMGYSKANQDTKISQDDGLVIDIKQGGEYSGAAALTSYPIRDDFDAQIGFEVKSPQQATTFELAAIQVDPGYHHMDNSDLSRRSVNLTFDVHGAPPYASSERDESDGFRIGWNNGPAVTQFVQYTAQSSNIYNKYSRDVGDGSPENPTGRLRLVRHGDVFAAFYTDKHNENWVLCGTALVPTLCREVFLRLGAKHWPKRGRTPPANNIRFSEFRLWQW